MSDSRYIDGVLKEWGDRLYYGKHKGKKAKRLRADSGASSATAEGRGSSPVTPTDVRKMVRRTVKKTPEVMVKISGGAKDRRGIKAHMDYISRNGELSLEDQDGDLVTGREAVKETHGDWVAFANLAPGQKRIPDEDGFRKEAFNIILSMPPGTDPDAVRESAKAFAKQTFEGHKYVFVAHTDEAHPHVHLCVRAVDCDGKRLNPRKADLQSWREGFAEQLREHGIQANATKRAVRGRVAKGKSQALVHMERGFQSKRRPAPPRVHETAQQAIRDVATGLEPVAVHPAEAKLQKTRKGVITAYGAIAKALAGSDLPEDRKLAVAIVDHVKTMAPPKSSFTVAVEQQRIENRSKEQVPTPVEKGPEDRGR